MTTGHTFKVGERVHIRLRYEGSIPPEWMDGVIEALPDKERLYFRVRRGKGEPRYYLADEVFPLTVDDLKEELAR